MNESELRAGVWAALCEVAPEVEPESVAAGQSLREQVDLDSMDWLSVIVGLHRRFGIDIPEAHYAELSTVDSIVAYLARRLSLACTQCDPPRPS